ncbi:hypothetical protein ACROYT_G020384 [Oculina patagonica]
MFSPRNPLDYDSEIVRVESPNTAVGRTFISALLASGFRRIDDGNAYDDEIFLPCPLGTFYNSSSKGEQGCLPCPPGGFYSDSVGHVAISCKKCPNGSLVSFDKAPGTRPQDCKSCPEGTETDFFAGLRACQCLQGFHRTHMFQKCHKCEDGLDCKDDYAILKPGYWWKWRNESYKDHYIDFLKNLLASSPALDAFSVEYPHPMPNPYKCPIEGSCKGGLDSPCENGFEGPLCAVCSPGYYHQLQTCEQCPSKKWIVGQLSIIVAIILIICAVVAWNSKRKTKTTRARPLIDMFLSKLKIIIGFYQVTYGLLEAFSYIKWPESLELIGKYSGLLQMDILQIAPIQCLFPGSHIDAFGNLFAMMAINGAVIGLCGVTYVVRKLLIFRSQGLTSEERSRKVSETKELIYKNLFFFLFVLYLSTCTKTATVLPLACRKLCRDDQEEVCEVYLKTDYSIKCHVSEYNYLLIVAFISTVYVFALPIASFVALWKHRRVILTTRNVEKAQGPGSSTEIISGLCFLFENYKPRSWYWELVELSRKVILTSGLILVGQETRSYIGLAWVMAGMYGMYFSWNRPIQDATENSLMAASLAVTVFNLGIGAVSKIPTEKISSSLEPYADAVLFDVLVIGANTLVIALPLVQYAVHLFRYLKEWSKNPQWSFTCCLALILPLSDFQGAVSGLVQAVGQTEEIELPSTIAVVKKCGTVHAPLEADVKSDNKAMEMQDNNHLSYDNKKYHQGTQTEPFAFLTAHASINTRF